MAVIYTADVRREEVAAVSDYGAGVIRTETAFLSEIRSEEIRNKLERKIQNKESLTDEEIMQFILYPMSYRTKEEKQAAIREGIELAKQMDYCDEKTVRFILSGIVVFSDKVIDEETRNKVKRWLGMTGVGRLFLEEQEEAVRKAVEETTEKVTKSVTQSVTRSVTQKVKEDDWNILYQNCLKRGMSEEQARDLADCLKQ